MLPLQPNKMATDHKTHERVDNHQIIIIVKYGSHHFNGYGDSAI